MTALLEAQRKHWTIAQFLQMLDVGLIQPNERVELIDGEVVQLDHFMVRWLQPLSMP